MTNQNTTAIRAIEDQRRMLQRALDTTHPDASARQNIETQIAELTASLRVLGH